MATELAKAYVQIVPSAEGIKGMLEKDLGGEAAAAGNSAGKTLGDSIRGAFSKIGGVGDLITKGVTLPVAGLGAAAIKTGMDYEAGMSAVQAISGATGAEMDMLGEKAMEMARKTKFSTSDSADAYRYMAMAGWDATQMASGLSGIMNLAAASGEDLAAVSDIVTDALTAFGMQASDSGRFADVLAAASNSANTNVSMLGESFRYVAPVAGAMGFSVEDVSVALGLMANSGIKASQAGTALRTAITNMTSPTAGMAQVMQQYGISLTDADGTMLSLSDVMGQLRDQMGGLDESTQAAAASALFGKEAMSGMLAIINAAPEDFDKLTAAIGNSKGKTEEMASIMQDNAAGAFERLKSAVDVLFTQLSQSLLPAFTGIVEKVTEAVNWFGSLDQGTQQLILTAAGLAAAIGPVLSVIAGAVRAVGTISDGIGALVGLVGKAGSAFSGLFSILAANPIAAVIAAVAALAAGIAVLWNTNEDFRNAVKGIWDAITGFFEEAADAILAAWDGIKEFFAGVWDGIRSAFSGVGEFFQSAFQGAADLIRAAWDGVGAFFSGIAEGVRSAFEGVTAFLSDAFSTAWEAVRSAWQAAGEFFADVWSGIQNGVGTAGEAIGGALAGAWEAVRSAWDAAGDFFAGVWRDIQNAFSDVWNAFKAIGTDIVNGIREGIAGAWNGFLRWLGEKVGGIVDGVKKTLGIHSPSTVFAGIGENMALGLGEGWAGEIGNVQKRVQSGLDFGAAHVRLQASVERMAAAGSGSGAAPAYGAHNTYVTIHSPKAVDPVQAAREWQKTSQRMAMGYV